MIRNDWDLSKDLVIPVNVNASHWMLVVVDRAERVIRCFDSLFNRSLFEQTAKVVKRFLECVEQGKKNWEVQPEKCPQQQNGSDCGMFVMKFARCWSFGLPLDFSSDDISNFRKQVALEIADKKVHQNRKLRRI